MSRPYLYHHARAFNRSHKLSMVIARTEIAKAGFQISSPATAWEQFAVNADTVLVVTSVPLSSSKTYVHTIATSNTDGPAKKWSETIMRAIEKSKTELID